MLKVSYLTKGNMVVLMGVFGFLWLQGNTAAEEPAALLMGPTLPTPETLPVGTNFSALVSPEEFPPAASLLNQEMPFEELFRMPTGDQIASDSLRTRFILGRRVAPLIFKPNTTFRVSMKGGFGTYLNGREQGLETVPVDKELLLEEQIHWGFQAAETTIEFFNSTAMPLVGNVLSGFVEMGQGLQQMDRRLKKKYHLHLRYSNGLPSASYRVKF